MKIFALYIFHKDRNDKFKVKEFVTDLSMVNYFLRSRVLREMTSMCRLLLEERFSLEQKVYHKLSLELISGTPLEKINAYFRCKNSSTAEVVITDDEYPEKLPR